MALRKSSERDHERAPVVAECLPETATGIASCLIEEADPGRRARLLRALVAMNSTDAAMALGALLAHADAAVRAAGVDGLQRLPPNLARPALAALLGDPSPDIRIRALDVVDHAPDAEIEAWLIALLAREDHANVCAAVLEQLAEMGTPNALPAIRAAKARFADTPFIGFAADIAIAQIVGT
jgi:HEAT repeat protein